MRIVMRTPGPVPAAPWGANDASNMGTSGAGDLQSILEPMI